MTKKELIEGALIEFGVKYCTHEDAEGVPFYRGLMPSDIEMADVKETLIKLLSAMYEKGREDVFELSRGLVLEPENLKKQIEDYELLLSELSKPTSK